MEEEFGRSEEDKASFQQFPDGVCLGRDFSYKEFPFTRVVPLQYISFS